MKYYFVIYKNNFKIFLDKKKTEINLHHLKIFREDSRNKKASLDDRILKSEELQLKIEQYEDNLKPLYERYNKILSDEENLSTLKNKLLFSEDNLKTIKLAQKDLKSIIKQDFKGNDLDLEEAINNFNINLL